MFCIFLSIATGSLNKGGYLELWSFAVDTPVSIVLVNLKLSPTRSNGFSITPEFFFVIMFPIFLPCSGSLGHSLLQQQAASRGRIPAGHLWKRDEPVGVVLCLLSPPTTDRALCLSWADAFLWSSLKLLCPLLLRVGSESLLLTLRSCYSSIVLIAVRRRYSFELAW